MKTQTEAPDLYVPVSDLLLSVRARNCLARAEITTIHELVQIDPDRVLDWEKLGIKTLWELAGAIQGILRSLGPAWIDSHYVHGRKWLALPSKPQASKPPSRQDELLADVVQTYLTAQNERDRKIITRRLGLADGPVHTLESIGREFGLTRERIRQITANASDQLARRVRWHCRNLLPILSSRVQATGIASLTELATGLGDLGRSGSLDAEACLRMLLLGIPGQVHPLDPAGRLWTSYGWLDAEMYRRILDCAGKELSRVPKALDQVSARVAGRLGLSDDSQIRVITLVLRNSAGRFAVRGDNKIELLVPVEQNLPEKQRAFAYQYIHEQGIAIKADEILDAMSEMKPELVPASATRQTQLQALKELLESDDRFSWAGPSRFGLREWGYEAGVTSVGQAALALLQAANKPLSLQEIHETLRELYRVRAGSIKAALSSMKGTSVVQDGGGRWYVLR